VKKQVLVFRDQHIEPQHQVAFSRRFGPFEMLYDEDQRVLGFPEIAILSNEKVDGKFIGVVAAGDFWHVARGFLRAWVEGIKIFKTDKEQSLKVLAKYLKVQDRDILENSHEIYRPVYKKIPYGDRRAVQFALEQMAKEIPESAKLNADDFIDNGILSELQTSGFIDQIYAPSSKR
jgi:hypothetical protein